MNPLQLDIDAGLELLPSNMRTAQAKVLLYATSRQENPKRLPKQVGGPAVGDYQMESGGGVRGVLEFDSPTIRTAVTAVCRARGVAASRLSVYEALQHDPVLAAAFARLLYYTDPGRLPVTGDEQGAWDLYLRTWRPGAFKRQPEELRAKWSKSYRDAMVAYGLA